MKLEVYAAAPLCVRSQFSRGVSGQSQPANSTHVPGDCGRPASHRGPAHNEQLAKEHEHDEGEMDDNGDVCEEVEGHDSMTRR